MVRLLINLAVMFLFTMSFAHDTLISTSTPYSSGTVHLNVDNDTVTFSNGLKIISLAFEYPYQIPEEKGWNGGIACVCTAGKVVYKSDPSMITRWRGGSKIPLDLEHITGINVADWTQTTGNPDTLWTSAISVPLTTIPIDSLFLRVSNTDITQMSAKCLYYSSRPCCDIVRTITTQLVPDVTSIFYYLPASPTNPKMKLQITSVEIDSSSTESHGELGIFRNYIVSGINLRWAVDSVGNGRFDKCTSVAKKTRATVYTAGVNKYKCLKLNHSDQYTNSNLNDHCRYFSLKGEKITNCLRSGVFVKQ